MQLIVIAHNVRSTHNVGAILRSCDGFGVETFYATGYTPYPALDRDDRLPHLRAQITKRIAKTALGAETSVAVKHVENPIEVIEAYRQKGYTIAALEQSADSTSLSDYQPPEKIVMLLGEEVHGITPDLIRLCDVTLEIPMKGRKESFNVSVATGIAFYALSIKS